MHGLFVTITDAETDASLIHGFLDDGGADPTSVDVTITQGSTTWPLDACHSLPTGPDELAGGLGPGPTTPVAHAEGHVSASQDLVVEETDCGGTRIQPAGFALACEGSTADPVLKAMAGVRASAGRNSAAQSLQVTWP